MTSPQPAPCCASRRTVLRGAALAGAAGLGVTACGGKEGDAASATPTAPVELGAAGEVPVGGARLYREERVLVTRPKKDEYRAFSAVCTHAGCVVSKIEDSVAVCHCHGSKFDANTGKVLHGPASVPLPEVPVRVTGDRLVAGPKG
ncbi:Rieske (2Fe-2S) protein [Streptomyces mobaraensis NBRC 13819 = DSM 40847]|uniref:Cytochrome bc1 complex Rieske iron-sulfur subunit n=2 Tax=Streptomyces mobaraensis TaxID=35621 RepID=A0A5N5W611_STRMB|nr:Rieske (2Fe-2S) protein [Streptomyces mobaraensis]EME98884.1 Rieske (2Fe-2S) iron-sulfur domain-containing protein [Streptomyces mobaraensis NBRC 13819 = DSM 40847]KAB7843336.1 Rieske (2Fe-2S) protein [Streptomyces mobaraensis]QTT73295.1 Rieske (2Fe-2S) protein [Streptomyces mobaraensis NBRC 13819 = DSM 40847]